MRTRHTVRAAFVVVFVALAMVGMGCDAVLGLGNYYEVDGGSGHGGRAGTGGQAGTGGHPGTGGHGGHGGSGGSAASSAGSGGSPPVGDAIPVGAVSFFKGAACPAGWSPYAAGVGRFLVPTVGAAAGGTSQGVALAGGEDRLHTHTVSGAFSFNTFNLLSQSGGNDGVAGSAGVSFQTSSVPASTGLPYLQALVCTKTAAAVPHPAPLPSGLLMFFDAAACPAGWQQAAATQGRLLVALPAGGQADLAFGGAPQAGPTTHTHGVTASLVTNPHGIEAASAAGSSFAVNGIYTSMQPTGATDPALPTLALLHCQKQ